MSVRSVAADRAARSLLVDEMLRRRARSVMVESGLFRFLPLTGLMLEVGAASAHLVEAVMHRMAWRRCVAADPVRTPPPRLAARMARRDFYAVRADGARLAFADGRFDAAWCSFALHRLPIAAQDAVLAEMARVVRRGGSLILIEDTPSSPTEVAAARREDRWLRWPSPGSCTYRTPPEWRAALLPQGWRLVEEVAFTRLAPVAMPWPVPRRSFICHRV